MGYRIFQRNGRNRYLVPPSQNFGKFEMIEEHGPNLGKPYTDAFGEGLFEVRAKGAEGIGRSFFCYASGKKIIILHSFVKKTQKTPQKEIEIALKRKKEISHEQ